MSKVTKVEGIVLKAAPTSKPTRHTTRSDLARLSDEDRRALTSEREFLDTIFGSQLRGARNPPAQMSSTAAMKPTQLAKAARRPDAINLAETKTPEGTAFIDALFPERQIRARRRRLRPLPSPPTNSGGY